MEYIARKSNLVVPEGFVELDREEMTYVDGGGSRLIGTYSAFDNAGCIWLAKVAADWFTVAGVYVADALFASACACATAPSVVGGIIWGAISFVSGLIGGIVFSLGQSAINAMEDAKYAQSLGKSYKVYENTFLGITTGYSVRT